MSIKDKKKEFLLSMGFKPLLDTKNNTLYVRGKYIMSSSDDNESLESMEKKIKDFFKNEDIVDRVSGVQEESIEKQGVVPTEEPAASENLSVDGEQELPFVEETEDPFKDNSEEVEPFYLCDTLKNIPTPIFRRLSLDGNRYYYRVLEDGGIKIYASATNLIKDGYVEKSNSLNEWKELQRLMGKDPEEVSQYEADKGTIMHMLYGLYLTGRDFFLRRSHIIKLIEESDIKISKKNLDRFKSSVSDIDNMIERVVRFAKFCHDYKVKVLAIEKILSCEQYEVASPIDSIVEMTIQEKEEGYFGEVYKVNGANFKKGDPKKSIRITDRTFVAILDFKSGGIYPSHSFQLNLYKMMVKEWYGDVIEIEKIYNFSPKSESNKGYTLRDQTDCKELIKADVVYQQGYLNHRNKDKVFKTYIGCLNINKPYMEEDYTITYDIAEELAKRFTS